MDIKLDRKTIIELIITAIGAVVLLVVFFPKKKPKKNIQPIAVGETLEKKQDKPSKEDKNELRNLQKEIANRPWGRDPFFFATTKKVYEGRALVLQGVTVGEKGKAYAMINNEIVTVGDMVEDYKILEILPDKVLLKKGGDSFYLSMSEESKK